MPRSILFLLCLSIFTNCSTSKIDNRTFVSSTGPGIEYNAVLLNHHSWKWERLKIEAVHWTSHYAEYTYVHSSHATDTIINTIELTQRQLDVLQKFEEMIFEKKMTHNQGIKLASRKGMYFVSENRKITSFTDYDNLYSLLLALGINPKKSQN